MAGPKLEVFKFGLYLFFPIVLMVQYGTPEWYFRNVVPYKDRIFPREEDTYKPPHTPGEVHAELERIKVNKIARKIARDQLARGNGPDEGERLV